MINDGKLPAKIRMTKSVTIAACQLPEVRADIELSFNPRGFVVSQVPLLQKGMIVQEIVF